jgi:hypothetical protein
MISDAEYWQRSQLGGNPFLPPDKFTKEFYRKEAKAKKKA